MILCVDPDRPLRTETERTLGDAGFEVAGTDSLADARERLDAVDSMECLITEQQLPDGTGLELIQYARETSPDTA